MIRGETTKAIDAKSSDYNTLASLTEINCNAYSKLLVWYQISSTSWDRAGNIVVYGSMRSDSADASTSYVSPDDTVENATFAITSTDDAKTGAGEWYVVENIAPYIKIGWDNTTAGTTGTITVYVMPFNE